MTKEKVLFEEELVVTKQVYYNEDNNFGVYGFKFAGTPNPMIDLHPIYRNFSIAGNIQQLAENEKYTVVFYEGFDERRNMNAYFFEEVKSEGIKGRKANEDFLKAVLTEKQALAISKQIEFLHIDELVKAIANDEVDISIVKGIGESHKEVIKNKLKDVDLYSEAIIKLAPVGVGINSIISLVNAFGDAKTLLQKVNSNIYSLTKVKGFGFKTIDEYAMKLGYKENDPKRIRSGAFYVIDELVKNGDTKIRLEDFSEKMCTILNIEDISDDLFNKIINTKGIRVDSGFITLQKYYEEEKEIAYHLRRIRDNFVATVNEDDMEKIIKKNEVKQGFTFNKEQREAIYSGANNGVFILDGKAGSGKSKITLSLVDVVGTNSHKGITLSGKAANVLAKNGLNASTIHRALIEIKVMSHEGGTYDYQIDYDNATREDPLFSEQIIVLDEASMVDNGLFLQILRAIPNGHQIAIVGDSGQLPAIGRGAIFDYLLSATEFAHVTLTQVHRQAQDSGTLEVANKVREGKQFLSYNADYEKDGVIIKGNNKDFYTFAYQNKTKILPMFIAMVERYINNPDKNNDDLQIITGLKERGDLSVANLNKLVQPLFNPSVEGADEFQSGKYTYRKGDRVIQQGNNYKATVVSQQQFVELTNGFISADEIETTTTEVFNGTFGKIVDCVQGYGLLIQFEDTDGLVYYHKGEKVDEIKQIDLGYVISCHRSQGSGFKDLFVVVTYNEYMLLSKQFLYTALTRTIDNCFLFCETKAVAYAVKTDKGKTRNCYLGDFIK